MEEVLNVAVAHGFSSLIASVATLGSGEECEGCRVAWPDDVEVPTIECGDGGDAETFGGGDHRSIDGAEW